MNAIQFFARAPSRRQEPADPFRREDVFAVSFFVFVVFFKRRSVFETNRAARRRVQASQRLEPRV